MKYLAKKRHVINRLILLLIPIFFITITGCGGGGGGGNSGGGSVSPAVSATSTSDITLTWSAPTTNTDANSLTDLSGYKIYFGQVSGIYNNSQDIACTATCGCTTGLTCTYTVDESLLGTGQWCFVITAYDSNPNESVYSEEICSN